MSNNEELVHLLDEMKTNNTQENAQKLTALLEKAILHVPAVLPANTNPDIIKQMMQNGGVDQPIPEGARPQPFIIQNNEGRKFFPLFTSVDEIKKGKNLPSYPLILNMNFKGCMDIVTGLKDIEAAVINPYSHNIVMNVKKNEKQPVKLTEAQLHAVIRQQTESRILPKKLFEEGESFVNDLCDREGECIMELYEPPYKQTRNCPYKAEDFDFMILNISDDMKLIRITMPKVKLYPDTCMAAFIAWNPNEKSGKYFAIVKGRAEEPDKLFQVMPDGSVQNHGAAPDEGSELQSIIDIATA